MQNIVRNNFRRFKQCFDISLFRYFSLISQVTLRLNDKSIAYIENALGGPSLSLTYVVILLSVRREVSATIFQDFMRKSWKWIESKRSSKNPLEDT